MRNHLPVTGLVLIIMTAESFVQQGLETSGLADNDNNFNESEKSIFLDV